MLQLRPLHAHVDRLGLRGLELRVRLKHVSPRCDARVVPVLRQLPGTSVGRHRLVEERLLRIEGAELEIVLG